MKTKFLLSLLLFTASISGYSTTWTVTNSGFTFSPDAITISLGDEVQFTLESMHDAIEVSQETWLANGNTALAGGFQTQFGGGLVLPAALTAGTHYYVCSPHASSGMKGVIIVNNSTGIPENEPQMRLSVYPNPANSFMTIKASRLIPDTEYSITDQTGRQVMNGKLTDETTTVDIHNLATGIYLFQLGDQRKSSFKVIKN